MRVMALDVYAFLGGMLTEAHEMDPKTALKQAKRENELRRSIPFMASKSNLWAGPDPSLKTWNDLGNPIGTTQKLNQSMSKTCHC